MNKIKLIITHFYFLLTYTLLFACERPQDLLVNGKTNTTLAKILKKTNISPQESPEIIIKSVQRYQNEGGWRRESGKERHDMQEIFTEKRKKLLPLFKQLGLVDVLWLRYPSNKKYKYCVFFAAWVNEARKRQRFLFDIFKNRDVTAEKLIFLTGHFNPTVQEKNLMADLTNEKNGIISFKNDWKYVSHQAPQTETEMIKILFDQAEESNCLHEVDLMYTDTKAAQGKQRATTEDTIKDLFSRELEPGSILAISSQPYRYQEACLRVHLPENFRNHILDVVGPAADNETPNCIYLDSLAKWLWEEQRIREGKK